MCTFYFHNNLGKCESILIILSLLHSQVNCRRWWNKMCHLTNLLPHYLAKMECAQQNVSRFPGKNRANSRRFSRPFIQHWTFTQLTAGAVAARRSVAPGANVGLAAPPCPSPSRLGSLGSSPRRGSGTKPWSKVNLVRFKPLVDGYCEL